MRENITPKAKLNAISVVSEATNVVGRVDVGTNIESGTSGISQHKHVEEVNAIKVVLTII